MTLNKSDFTGTGYVYRFSLLQMVKGTANIVALIIFFLIAVAVVPILAAAGQEPEAMEYEMGVEEDEYTAFHNSIQTTVITENEYLGIEEEANLEGVFAVQYG